MNAICKLSSVGLVMLSLSRLWAQNPEPAGIQPQPAGMAAVEDTNDGSMMLVPPPVSGAALPSGPASAERSNYLRGGIVFTGAYVDNILGGRAVNPVSDESYSVAPTVELDKTTTRTALRLSYAPGFTFYQHTSELNESDHNAGIDFQYRVTEHVTFVARDSFHRSSNVLNQENSFGGVGQAPEAANFSIIAPLADRLSNDGNAGINYQFSANSMIGVNGSFSNLHYPNPSQVPGLFDASSQSGSVFYTHRLAKRHYVGTMYRYERLLSYPSSGDNETTTNAFLVFYSFYPTRRFSLSFFGGPEHSDTTVTFAPGTSRSWTPEAGGGLNWQGLRTSVAVNYEHLIASGGGLIGAVHMDNANATIGQRITKTLQASVIGGWAQNNLLDNELFTNGHSTSVGFTLRQKLGQHAEVGGGYSWLHQSYSSLPLISEHPVTNREFVSVSYQFEHALGR